MEEIFVPASGMAMEDVLFTEWLKQPGDEVAAGDAVAVVETDKSTVELTSTTAGRLSGHLVAVGDRVLGGATVAYVLKEGEVAPAAVNAVVPAQVPLPVEAERALTTPPPPGRDADGKHRLSPRQRRAMAGAAAAGSDAEEAESPVVPVAKRVPGPSSRNREATAVLVSESWRTVPHFSVGRDVRVDGLAETVAAVRADGTAVTVTDFLILALARSLDALGEPPDIGLAVATEWGVLIPVLHPLSGRSVREVTTLRTAAVNRARNRRLESADSATVFATLSNLGTAGVTWFTGVVPINQVALVTVGEISLRPAVEGRGLVVAPILTAVVTADHRRYDGIDSAKLLSGFVEQLVAVIEEEAR
jgi:pyruvate dehydrogenase E2 component (dihydrolipoamide acetyltransferase)